MERCEIEYFVVRLVLLGGGQSVPEPAVLGKLFIPTCTKRLPDWIVLQEICPFLLNSILTRIK